MPRSGSITATRGFGVLVQQPAQSEQDAGLVGAEVQAVDEVVPQALREPQASCEAAETPLPGLHDLRAPFAGQ